MEKYFKGYPVTFDAGVFLLAKDKWFRLGAGVTCGVFRQGVAGDGCGGAGLGVGGVSSWRFLLPKVSLFLTATGVTGGVLKLNKKIINITVETI